MASDSLGTLPCCESVTPINAKFLPWITTLTERKHVLSINHGERFGMRWNRDWLFNHQIINTERTDGSVLSHNQRETIRLWTDVVKVNIVGKYLLNFFSDPLPCPLGPNSDFDGNVCTGNSLFRQNAVCKVKASTPESCRAIRQSSDLQPTGTLTGTMKLLSWCQ